MLKIYTGFIGIGLQTYKVFFAVVNCDGLKRGLRWGSETYKVVIVFLQVFKIVFTWRGVMSNAVISSSPPPSSS